MSFLLDVFLPVLIATCVFLITVGACYGLASLASMEDRHKVELPKDRDGTSIEPGSWMVFDDGLCHIVALVNYEGGTWEALTEDEDYIDNLSGGTVVTMPRKWRSE